MPVIRFAKRWKPDSLSKTNWYKLDPLVFHRTWSIITHSKRKGEKRKKNLTWQCNVYPDVLPIISLLRHLSWHVKYCRKWRHYSQEVFSPLCRSIPICICFMDWLINPFQNKPLFLRVCSRSLLKTLREKEKLLVTSNFSFSHSVFYPFGDLSAIFIKFENVVCKLFQFWRV